MQELAAYATAPVPVKRRLPVMPFATCGVVDVPLVGPGAGQHAARALCSGCHRFLKWIPRALIEGRPAMSSVNKAIVTGTISKYGVTVKFATIGTPVASFALVLTKQDREGKVHTLYQDCEVVGRKAEAASAFEAGALCLFEGELSKRKRGGETWETVIVGFELVPLVPLPPSMTGSRN